MQAEATITSTGELEKKSSAELVALYNSLCPDKPVKKFSDRPTAVKRCLALLGAAQGKATASAPPTMPVKPDLSKPAEPEPTKKDKPEKKPKEPKAPKTTGDPNRIQFDFKPANIIKPHRDGTKRAQVVALLTAPGGATFDEVAAAIKWDARTTYEGIKLIHSQLGWGLREDPTTHKIQAYKK